jgi:hypothetical protein
MSARSGSAPSPDRSVRTRRSGRSPIAGAGAANGTYAGDPDRQRKGSLGDVDRDVIVTFERDAEHPRIATHRMLRRLLGAVTLDGEPADRLVDELHVGHGLVLADLAPSAAGERRGIAGRAARL